MPGETSDRSAAVLKRHLDDFLARREPPKTFCPSEVARALSADELADLGCEGWRDAMPHVRAVAWEARRQGRCEVLQKGEAVGDVSPEDVRGPIRIRRVVL